MCSQKCARPGKSSGSLKWPACDQHTTQRNSRLWTRLIATASIKPLLTVNKLMLLLFVCYRCWLKDRWKILPMCTSIAAADLSVLGSLITKTFISFFSCKPRYCLSSRGDLGIPVKIFFTPSIGSSIPTRGFHKKQIRWNKMRAQDSRFPWILENKFKYFDAILFSYCRKSQIVFPHPQVASLSRKNLQFFSNHEVFVLFCYCGFAAMMFLTCPPRPKMAERVWEQKKVEFAKSSRHFWSWAFWRKITSFFCQVCLDDLIFLNSRKDNYGSQ